MSSVSEAHRQPPAAQRYLVILQEQIAATLDDPSELDDEIRSLFDAIRPEPTNR